MVDKKKWELVHGLDYDKYHEQVDSLRRRILNAQLEDHSYDIAYANTEALVKKYEKILKEKEIQFRNH